jgi:ankyrin repeat protein/beta-lactamase regulating signal transducer with metallopeptidase domain
MTSTIAETALALGAWVELSILSKATVILVLGLTAARMARRARASVRHLLVVTTLAAVLALPLIAILLPAVTIEVPISSAIDARPVSRTVQQSDLPISITLSEPSRPAPEKERFSAPSWPTVARSLWLAGALLMLASPVVGLLRLRRIRREGLPWPELCVFAQSLATQCGVRRSVEVLLHEEIPAPLTFGIWRPAIILPTDAQGWKEADLRRALVHELEHVRRGDWLIQLWARALCAFYWFHPLVWVAWRRLRLEAERSSDDAVLETSERTEYAEQLVSLASRLSRSPGRLTLGMANRSDLSARVSTLLDGTQRRGRAGLLAAASAICVASLLLLVIAPVRAVAQFAKRQTVVAAELESHVDPGSVNEHPSVAFNKGPGLAQSDVEYKEWSRLFPSDDPIGNDVLLKMAEVHLHQMMTAQGSSEPTQVLKERQQRGSEPFDEPLFEAAEKGDIGAVQELLKRGANVNCVLDGDGSPLIGAALNGHLTVVHLLLDRGADPNLAVLGDGNPLIVAAREGHIAVVRLLLDRGADPNIPVPGDGNPLIMAAREGRADIVELLLDRGAKIDQMVPDDENALIQASGEGRLNVVKLLVSRGADVNARAWVGRALERPDGEWRTPLSMARKGRHDAIVAFLLEAGARD